LLHAGGFVGRDRVRGVGLAVPIASGRTRLSFLLRGLYSHSESSFRISPCGIGNADP
jgi:hypothetical protein